MKKLLLAAIALTTATGVFAQGTVLLNNRISGQVVNQTTHIWGPSSTAPTLSLIGLGSNDSPAGSVNFAGSGMALIGAGGASGKYGYATTFAQLIGAINSGQPEASLVPVGQTTTFRSGTSLGDVAGITSTIGSIPADYAGGGTFEMVAWDNSSGLYPTWAQASVAWLAGTIAAGKSPIYNVAPMGGVINNPASLSTMQSMSSFNLYMSIPEPSSFALVGLGAAAMMIFRRRK